MIPTAKICQLTGTEDRGNPGTLTGAELSGVTGGVTGTDLGYSFEYEGRLFFLFGDSREFPPDLCEPAWCGTDASPIAVLQPNPEKVQRWPSESDWEAFKRARGDGYDSMATAPADCDPDQTIPIHFETTEVGLVFSHEIAGDTVGAPIQLSGSRVASNPQDKHVLVLGNRTLVITEDGRVFAHEVTGAGAGVPFQLSGPLVAANPIDKRVLTMDNRILVITQDGSVFVHEVAGNTIGAPFQFSGPPVAANPQDKWVLAMGNRILVVVRDGRVFAHHIAGNTIEAPFQLSGPPVAANPQDKWVLAMGNRILVVVRDGRVFAHEIADNQIRDATLLRGPRVAANPRDRRVLVLHQSVLVLTERDGTFRPTRLDGRPVARKEGAISGFTDGPVIYAFFTLRDKPLGCSDASGCAHDDPEPGGQTVLAKSLDGGRNFGSISVLSTVKFLWAVPDVQQSTSLSKLPEGVSGPVLLVWGAGRENNDRGNNVAPWNHSYPFLAVAPLSSRGEPDGKVFVHELTGNTIGVPFQLGGPRVASNPRDRRVIALGGDRILVNTLDGSVFVHDVTNDAVGTPFQLGGARVGANAEDKWVLGMGTRILVITDDGSVFVHEVTGTTVRAPFRLNGPSVAANPQDKRVLVMGSRILVITTDGRVFAHNVTANAVDTPFQLGSGVAANPQDRWVLATDNRILVVTADGRVFVHDVAGNTMGVPFQLNGWSVAVNPHDKHVLVMGRRILVITRQAWKYFAGLDAEGQPGWKDHEEFAVPMPPFGSPDLSLGFHKSFGYFSVRYIEGWQRWVMLYTCNNDAKAGYNPENGPRGVYLRTASAPWGPWSPPQQIFDPREGYCAFMHNQNADFSPECDDRGLNPAEESVRDVDPRLPGQPTKRGWGGEYAPYLLPSRYAKVEKDKVILYFVMSTWNPYQVVLMRTEISVS